MAKEIRGESWPQILAIGIGALGAFTNGIMAGWSSPFAVKIVKDKINYQITEQEASLFIVIFPLGMIFASLFFFKISERLGRKKSLLILAVPHLLSWLITIFARTKWAFYAARFVAGMGESILFCSLPPYIGEIATPSVRGSFGNIPSFIINLGNFFITVLGTYVNISKSAYICMGIPVIYAILVVTVLPESPYQLIKEGRYEEAKQTIKWLTRKPNISDDFLSMKSDVERQLTESGTWRDLYKIKSNRKALRAGIFLRFAQMMSGMSVFSMYTQTIFLQAGGNVSAEYCSMIFMGTMSLFLLVCGPLPEKYGRKLTFFWSLLSCGSILIMLSIYFFLDQYNLADLTKIGWFPLVGMVACIISFAPGLGIVPSVMLGELFSVSIKAKALCLLLAPFGFFVFCSSLIFQLLNNSIGFYAPFLFYGVVCLVCTALTLKWVPETKGKTLEEIQQELKK